MGISGALRASWGLSAFAYLAMLAANKRTILVPP